MVRVTDPFNEKVRARIFGNSISYYSSSGSEHDAESDVVSSSSPSSSLCLSHLVLNFLEDDSDNHRLVGESTRFCDSDSDSDDFHPRSDSNDSVVVPMIRNNVDSFRNQVLVHVNRSVEIFSTFRKNRSVFNRNLMAYLREIGYNAGVCKTRWETSGGLTAGNYEFIDIISPDQTRYLIDADFSGEFEIARETETYAKSRRSLPRVLVAKPDDLKRIVRFMCDEARRSMKINGLTLPPWRKNRYMQAKWLGPYRRTTNPLPTMTSSSGNNNNNFAVKCRSVGFDVVAGDNCRGFFPPATRTR